MPMDAYVSSWVKSLQFALSLYLYPYLVYASSEGSISVSREIHMFFFIICYLFLKFGHLKKIFQKNHQRVKQLDPDQVQHFVMPDLDPKALHWLSADTSRQRVDVLHL